MENYDLKKCTLRYSVPSERYGIKFNVSLYEAEYEHSQTTYEHRWNLETCKDTVSSTEELLALGFCKEDSATISKTLDVHTSKEDYNFILETLKENYFDENVLKAYKLLPYDLKRIFEKEILYYGNTISEVSSGYDENSGKGLKIIFCDKLHFYPTAPMINGELLQGVYRLNDIELGAVKCEDCIDKDDLIEPTFCTDEDLLLPELPAKNEPQKFTNAPLIKFLDEVGITYENEEDIYLEFKFSNVLGNNSSSVEYGQRRDEPTLLSVSIQFDTNFIEDISNLFYDLPKTLKKISQEHRTTYYPIIVDYTMGKGMSGIENLQRWLIDKNRKKRRNQLFQMTFDNKSIFIDDKKYTFPLSANELAESLGKYTVLEMETIENGKKTNNTYYNFDQAGIILRSKSTDLDFIKEKNAYIDDEHNILSLAVFSGICRNNNPLRDIYPIARFSCDMDIFITQNKKTLLPASALCNARINKVGDDLIFTNYTNEDNERYTQQGKFTGPFVVNCTFESYNPILSPIHERFLHIVRTYCISDEGEKIFPPPASELDIQEFENYWKFDKLNPLPNDIRDFISFCTGEEDIWGLVAGNELLSIEKMIHNHKLSLTVDYDLETYHKGFIKNGQFNKSWIPFADGCDGAYFCFDFDPDIKGVKGQIIAIDLETNASYLIAKDLSSFLNWLEIQHKELNIIYNWQDEEKYYSWKSGSIFNSDGVAVMRGIEESTEEPKISNTMIKISELLIGLRENKIQQYLGENETIKVQPLGEIKITTGQIVATDAVLIWDLEPYTTKVPIGSFPVYAYIQLHKTDKRVAFAEIRFNENVPIRFEMAVIEGQDIHDLFKGECFGYGVDSGTGCFMDKVVCDEIHAIDGDFDELLDALDNSYVNTYETANVEVPSGNGNIVAFSTGYGDGMYASFFGYDENDNVCCLISDFQLIEIEEE